MTTYNASTSNPWSSTAFGNDIVFTNGVDVPQVFTIGTSTAFSDLGGPPPIGRFVTTVRNFLMFGNTTESATVYPQRIHWSGIGADGTYPTLASNAAAEQQSDAQDLRSDLGWVRGLASNLQSADVAIFLDYGVYSGWYIGSPAVFNFQIAQGATGCKVSNSLVVHRGFAYYLGLDGFYAFDGTTPRNIGGQKVDRFFYQDPDDGVDQSYLFLTQGGVDPSGKLVFWAYCGPNSGGVPNRLLIYNWLLDRWSVARLSVSWIVKGLTLGYSLDDLDPFGTVDTLPYSLDSPFWQGGSTVMLAMDENNKLAAFSGPNLAATVETTEVQPTTARRSRITNSRPLVQDGTSGNNAISGTPSVALGYRNNLGEAVTYTNPVDTNIWGECPQRLDTRYVRAQINMPAGAAWHHIAGVELDYGKSTRR